MAKIAMRPTTKKAQGGSSTAGERREIEKLSYQFFVERGHLHGFDREDWLRAEAIVRSKRS